MRRRMMRSRLFGDGDLFKNHALTSLNLPVNDQDDEISRALDVDEIQSEAEELKKRM